MVPDQESDPRDRWSIFQFSLSNREGPGQGDVSKLLRSLGNHLDDLAGVKVQDIVFESQPTVEEDDLSMTVYYQRKPRHR